MDLTLLIQAGDTGPIKLIASTLETAGKELRAHQLGTPDLVRVVHATTTENTDLEIQLVEHRITDAWYQPTCLGDLAWADNLDQIADALSAQHARDHLARGVPSLKGADLETLRLAWPDAS